MTQTLILLAGYPGTGKSYLANQIMERNSSIKLCSPDDIKEEFWDTYGFQTLEEKEDLIQKSWITYYHRLETAFQQGNHIISDYPFSDKQKMNILEITTRYHVQVITIRLVGDIDVLFERQKKRDLDAHRHLGHVVLSYHKGMQVTHEQADNLLTYEEFYQRCTTRGYGEFTLGYTMEVDVSDFTKVNYEQILKFIQHHMQ